MLPKSSHLVFLLPGANAPQERIKLLYPLLWHWHCQNQRVCVLSPDQAYADFLDDYLWSAEASGFLPHCVASANSNLLQTVIITELAQAQACDILLNSTPTALPGFLPDCSHIELVASAETQPMRQRYKTYQQQGLSPQTRNLDIWTAATTPKV